MNYQVDIDNFDSICRICLLKKQNMRKYSTRNIINMVWECTSIKEPFNIKLPHQICDNCFYQLNVSYIFKQHYVRSVEILCNVFVSSTTLAKESEPIISIRDQLCKTSKLCKNQLINDSKSTTNSSGVPHQLLAETEFNDSNFKTENIDESSSDAIEIQADTKNEVEEEQNDETDVKNEETNSLNRENNESYYVLPVVSNDCEDKDDDNNATSSYDVDANREQNSEQRALDDNDDNNATSSYDVDANSEQNSEQSALDDNDTNSENEKEDGVNNAKQKHQTVADILISKYGIVGLTCNICNKQMTTRKSLLRHMQIHNKNRKFNYRCHVCKIGFYIYSNLKSHMKRHEGKPKYKCSMCPKRFYELIALARHNRIVHWVEPMDCGKCSFKFYHPLQLERHEKMHKEAEYKCDVCGKVFDYQYKLTVHQVSHSQVRQHTCTICNKSFKHKFTLKSHIKLQHEDPSQRQMCYICGKLFIVGLAAHMETHNSTVIYKCEICDCTYESLYRFRIHVKEEHSAQENKGYTCEVCGHSLRSKKSLSMHRKVVHTNVRIDCSYCGKGFKTRQHLKMHVSSVHMNIRPHSCMICGKAFHRKDQLKKHMRSHTGERPYSCTICNKAFGYREVLDRHLEIHKKYAMAKLKTEETV